MFRFCWSSCCKKKSTTVDVLTSGSQRSVSVLDIPDAATNNKDEGTPWRYRLFGRSLKKQSVVTSQNNKTTESKKAPKFQWWHCCRKRNQVAPAPEEQRPNVQSPERQSPEWQSPKVESPKVESHSTTSHLDMEVEFKGLTEEEENMSLLPAVPKKQIECALSTPKTLRQQLIKYLGFPNPTQICYLNSCLQSLLTLKDFVKAISRQEEVWRLIPEAALVRSFMAIKVSHFSGDASHKIRLLNAFKMTIWSPVFWDLHQKDAHEFLTSMLEQIRSLSPRLQMMAASLGRSYSCPVEDHMVFKMVNTRTCKRCVVGSSREEEFTNLSLDLVPGGGTMEQMLQLYLMVNTSPHSFPLEPTEML
ncbi:ubiquitin carboxyl-terminal hydrolase 37 [Etheostoma spectabile]|uniref:ubiquitin carboxyl-terminal hydrolase 37 n=1 Tax=Etheostoma spectabile TaxID=54343 RepID=UPI0013AF0143|nr:ubiquitin carboxyl-terminal hydrolase 37-like [Etheostoma spectabile]